MEKFWSKTEQQGECIVWIGSRDKKGYGVIRVDKKMHQAHRFIYQLTIGDIPNGYVIHHECENKSCIRVEHLTMMTASEHSSHHLRNRKPRPPKTHCTQGHEYTEANTYEWVKADGRKGRYCRTCHNAGEKRARASGNRKPRNSYRIR